MPHSECTHSHVSLIKAIQARQLRQVDIAIAIGASQSQVSRVLSGETSEQSRLFGRICDYVFGRPRRVTRHDVQQCNELVDALTEAWDGSNEQARSIASVIRGLALLTRRT